MRKAAFIILYFSVATYSFGASFDCSKALTPVEKQICSDAELSVLDEKLSIAYQRNISSSSNRADIIAAQKHWLQDKRNRCNDPACIKNAYEERLLILELGYDVSGCYIDEHLIDIMNIDERKAAKVSDYLDLVKLKDSRYKFFLNITRRNYNGCAAEGIAVQSQANDQLILTMDSPTLSDQRQSNSPNCQLKLKFTSKTILIETNPNACEQLFHCAFNVQLNSTEFSRANRASPSEYNNCHQNSLPFNG